MPKKTVKYTSAAISASKYGIKTYSLDQEALYTELNKRGLQWDSVGQEWIDF